MALARRFNPVTRHRNHPALPARKQILANVLIVRNLHLRGEKKRVEPSEQIEAIYREAMTAASTGLWKHPPQTLEEYLGCVGARVAELLPQMPLTDEQRALPQALAEELTNARTCSVCVGNTPTGIPACNGSLTDDAAMTKGLQCWNFITQLFDDLVQLVENHYAPLLPAEPEQLSIELHTQIASDAEISAQTEHAEDCAGVRVTRIRVSIPEKKFDHSHLAVLPYILFHELFVHAAEGFAATSRRAHTPDTCAFREGYMDSVAANLLVSICESHPQLLPAFHGEFADELSHSTTDAHVRRQKLRRMDQLTQSDQRLQCIHYARKFGSVVRRRLAQLIGDQGAREIGVGLNVLALNDKERAAVLELLDVSLRTSSSQRTAIMELREATQLSNPASIHERTAIVRRYINEPDY